MRELILAEDLIQTRSRFDGADDLPINRRCFTDHEFIWKSKNAPSVGAEPCIAPQIMSFLFRIIVRRSVQFDDELCRYANEISDIAINWDLAPKFHVQSAISQIAPENHLSHGLISA